MWKMKRVSLLVGVLALCLPVHAKIFWLSLDQLVSSSEHIVIARVQSIRVERTDATTGMSELRNELQVVDSVKGTWPVDTPLVLKTIQAEYWIEDNVVLPLPGTKVLLFLYRDDEEEYWPVNAIQGVWPFHGKELVGAGSGSRLQQVRETVRLQPKTE